MGYLALTVGAVAVLAIRQPMTLAQGARDAIDGHHLKRDVTGRVLTPDGTPAVGAVVFCCRPSSDDPDRQGFGKGVPVDANGAFRLKHVVYGRAADAEDYIIARLPGYGLLRADLSESDAQSPGIVLRLFEEATLTGTVVDQDGNRLSGASVTVDFVLYGYTEYLRRTVYSSTPMPGWTVRTDREGRFTIGWLPKAPICTATVTVRHRDFATTSQEVQVGVDAEPPKIVLKPGGAIEGRVVYGSTKQPAHEIALRAEGDETMTDDAGCYRFSNLSAGRCHVWIDLPEDGPWAARRWRPVTVSSDKTERVPDIVLVKGAILSGRVVDSRTKEGLSRVCVVASHAWASTGADGSFRILSPPGSHRLRYYRLPKAYRWCEHRMTSPFTLSAGQTIEGIQIEVPEGLTIAGKAVDAQGAPLPKAKVTCRGKSPQALTRGESQEHAITEYTDADGTFRVRGLPPKTPVILAVRDRGERLGGTLDLTSAEDAPTMVTIRTVPLAAITGRVVHGDGRPFPSAGVCAPWTTSRAVCTRADGTYELAVMPDTEVRLAACMTGYAMRSDRLPTVTLSPGERRTVEDIVLVRIVQLSGRVLDPAGEPVPNAEIELYRSMYILRAKTDERGRFSFKDFVPRAKRIPIRCRVPDRGLAVRSIIESGQQQIVLQLAEAAVLTGRVLGHDGRPIEGVHIQAYLVPDIHTHVQTGTATTDENGAYRVEGVIPGFRTYVMANKDGYVGAASKSANIAMAGVVDIEELVLVKGDSFIAGRVADLIGDPLPDVTVQCKFSTGSYALGTTNAKGRYRIVGVPSVASLQVVTLSRKHRQAVLRDVKPGSTDVDFLLEPKQE